YVLSFIQVQVEVNLAVCRIRIQRKFFCSYVVKFEDAYSFTFQFDGVTSSIACRRSISVIVSNQHRYLVYRNTSRIDVEQLYAEIHFLIGSAANGTVESHSSRDQNRVTTIQGCGQNS